MKFVRAENTDGAYFERLFRSAYEQVIAAQFGGWTEAEYRNVFEEIWEDQGFLKIMMDGRVVGGVLVEKYAQFWRLREILIEPDQQGKGYGSTVIKLIIDEAEKAGVELRLRVLIENRAAALYERLGFREVDRDDTHRYMTFDQGRSRET